MTVIHVADGATSAKITSFHGSLLPVPTEREAGRREPGNEVGSKRDVYPHKRLLEVQGRMG